ncbi:hypothetical protein HYG81_26035 (plasmid) [Natrinema zhouii]|uniref:RipA family octameric membrane protein n=1 Tax=Natrinema zhouii TaxID=1710539 RepID=UPI001CFF698E|nr:hypothetical protein [Natrinema zhouii]UHQ99289.1 hypothetical protein HYG81_26035 [Natrinema zhouii]
MPEPADKSKGESELNNADSGENTEDKDTPETEPEHSEEIPDGDPAEPAESETVEDGPLTNLNDEETDRLMDQYIHYGEVAIETANQRVQMNRFFGLILTSILAGLFALARGNLTATSAAIVVFASGFGSLICYFWYQSLQSYRRLNKARYAILNQIESALPVRMYLDEWRYLKREKPDPEIIDPRPNEDPDHRSHTIVEQWFVRLLAAGYLTVGGYAGGFILTPFITDAGYSLLSPTTVRLIIGAIVMAGSIVIFWIRSR